MSGFFLVRRAAVPLDRLRPDGFKILLEILARSSDVRVSEVPFVFASRAAGESKADLRQGLVYVRHLLRLRTGGVPARLAGFLAIGAAGTVPNLATMAVLGRAGVHYLAATAVATLVAATFNFVMTDTLLFRGRAGRRPMRERWAGYVGLSAVDIVLRVPLMGLLVERVHLAVLVATVLSIVVAGVMRFVVVDRWLYRADVALTGAEAEPAAAPRGHAADEPAHGHRVLREAMSGAA
jgi:dolichol-phosphate mannosyltransferase